MPEKKNSVRERLWFWFNIEIVNRGSAEVFEENYGFIQPGS